MTRELVDLQEVAERCGRSVEEVERIIARAKSSVDPRDLAVTVQENGISRCLTVTRFGVGIIDTDHGKFWEYSFHINDQWRDYMAIWKGDVDDTLMPVVNKMKHLLIRTDSGCETGQVMGDRTCECREQLHIAMKALVDNDEGLIIHIPRQDGRGMGVPFKLATLYLQDLLGLNTVESAIVMSEGEEFDVRTYGGVVAVLKFFGINTSVDIDLATNNPRKVGVFAENGYKVNGMKPIVAPVTERLKRHLAAKQEFLGHVNLIKEVANDCAREAA